MLQNPNLARRHLVAGLEIKTGESSMQQFESQLENQRLVLDQLNEISREHHASLGKTADHSDLNDVGSPVDVGYESNPDDTGGGIFRIDQGSTVVAIDDDPPEPDYNIDIRKRRVALPGREELASLIRSGKRPSQLKLHSGLLKDDEMIDDYKKVVSEMTRAIGKPQLRDSKVGLPTSPLYKKLAEIDKGEASRSVQQAPSLNQLYVTPSDGNLYWTASNSSLQKVKSRSLHAIKEMPMKWQAQRIDEEESSGIHSPGASNVASNNGGPMRPTSLKPITGPTSRSGVAKIVEKRASNKARFALDAQTSLQDRNLYVPPYLKFISEQKSPINEQIPALIVPKKSALVHPNTSSSREDVANYPDVSEHRHLPHNYQRVRAQSPKRVGRPSITGLDFTIAPDPQAPSDGRRYVVSGPQAYLLQTSAAASRTAPHHRSSSSTMGTGVSGTNASSRGSTLRVEVPTSEHGLVRLNTDPRYQGQGRGGTFTTVADEDYLLRPGYRSYQTVTTRGPAGVLEPQVRPRSPLSPTGGSRPSGIAGRKPQMGSRILNNSGSSNVLYRGRRQRRTKEEVLQDLESKVTNPGPHTFTMTIGQAVLPPEDAVHSPQPLQVNSNYRSAARSPSPVYREQLAAGNVIYRSNKPRSPKSFF